MRERFECNARDRVTSWSFLASNRFANVFGLESEWPTQNGVVGLKATAD